MSTTTTTTPTTPRCALFQQDLFHCVLDCLVTPGANSLKFRRARPALASLAQTCRAFSEPSLDRLWYRLDSLAPLVQCYAAAFRLSEDKIPPYPGEWVIVRRYSHRVRELRVDIDSACSISFLRANIFHPFPLLPNLKALTWNPWSSWDISNPGPSIAFIQRLLSPSLVSLRVNLGDPEDGTLQSFLANYPSLCSNLDTILIGFAGRKDVSRTTTEILSRTIIQYERIGHLDISVPVDDIALMHIVMSTTLKKLALVLHPNHSHLHRICIPSDAIPFCNVRDLDLDVWDLCFITTLLRDEGQMFRSFALCHRSRPATDVLFSFFTALASRQRTHSLRSIVLGLASRDSASAELPMRPYLTYDVFPLAPLCRLRKLVVDIGLWFSFSDDDLVSLTRNWPSLKILRLRCSEWAGEYPWRWTKYITFNGLLSLLECCPNLSRLCLPLDARQIPVSTKDVICNPNLTYLDLVESPISDARSVQHILARHFPFVVEVCVMFNPAEDQNAEVKTYIELWNAVNEHLGTIPHSPVQAA